MMNSIAFPLADMYVISKNSRLQRKPKSIPLGLSCVDYGRVREIDNFYIMCQDMRDYYKDVNNQLLKPIGLKGGYGKCSGRGSSALNKNTELLSEPPKWVQQQKPYICPTAYHQESLALGPCTMNLGGRYDKSSQINYKR